MNQTKHPSKPNNLTTRVAANKDVVVAEQVESPLPHPSILAQYEEIVPGSAKAVFDDYRANAQTIRELETKGLNATIEKDKRGQYLAFFISLSIVILSAYALYLGHPVVAGSACFAALGLIGSSYLKKQ